MPASLSPELDPSAAATEPQPTDTQQPLVQPSITDAFSVPSLDGAMKQPIPSMPALTPSLVSNGGVTARQAAANDSAARPVVPLGGSPVANGQVVSLQHPGVDVASTSLLASGDAGSAYAAIGNTSTSEGHAAGAGLVAGYADKQESGLPGAQIDFAKMDSGVKSGIITGEAKDLWTRYTKDPASLSEEDAQKLLGMVSAVGDSTSFIKAPDLSFSGFAKVSDMKVTDTGASFQVSLPAHPGEVWLDPYARAAAIDALDMRGLAERGRQNLSRLYDEAAHYPEEMKAPDSYHRTSMDKHIRDAYLGLQTTVGPTTGDHVIGAVLMQVANDKGVAPDILQSVVAQHWRSLIQNADGSTPGPFRLPEADGTENQVFVSLSGKLPAELALAVQGVPSTIPLVKDQTSGMFAGTDGTLSHVGKVTVEQADRLRHLYPVMQRADGVAHWAASAPQKVRDVGRLNKELGQSDPTHTSETWLTQQLISGHPATIPGNHIMVSVPEDVDPSFLADHGAATDLGSMVTNGPTRSLERLKASGVDARTFQDPQRSPLATHAWAALGVDGPDANRMLHELRQKGYNPIPNTGVGLYLVFGISPAEASAIAFGYGQTDVLTHAGVVTDGDTLQPIDSPSFHDDGTNTTALRGGGIRWAVDPQGPPTSFDPSTPVERSSKSARRVLVTIQNADAHRIGDIADRLSAQGAVVEGVYSHDAVPGYQRARDHVFQDAVSTHVVRTTDPELTSRHGYPVWVKDATGLPKSMPKGQSTISVASVKPLSAGSFSLDDRAVLVGPDEVHPTDWTKSTRAGVKAVGAGIVTSTNDVPTISLAFNAQEASALSGASEFWMPFKSGKVEMATDPGDLTASAHAVSTLGSVGLSPDVLDVKADGFPLSEPVTPTSAKPKASLGSGELVSAMKRTSAPVPEWIDRYGVPFDPSWRAAGTIKRLDGITLREMKSTMDAFHDIHPSVVKTWGLSRVGMAPPDAQPDWMAYTEAEMGGGIGLGRSYFGDRGQAEKEHALNVANGYLTDAKQGAHGDVLAHELAHVLHYTSQQTLDPMEQGVYDKQLKTLFRLNKSTIASDVSAYAATDWQEFVAESLTKQMFGSGNELTGKVYAAVTARLAQGTAYKKASGWN